jgi:glycosyltransferase involved in cell wall biosynthesis
MPRQPEHAERKLRILCIAPYPTAAPSVYHRIWAYRPLWSAHGVELTVWPFMSDRFYAIRRTFGPAATLRKAIHFGISALRLAARIWRVRRYDAVIIHREVFPLGPPFFERLVARLHPDVTFDLDDAMWCAPSNPVHQRGLLWDPERVPKIMAACARVTAGSEHIADFARRYNARVIVLPTGCDDLAGAAASGAQPPRTRPVVAWIGNLGNAGYVRDVLPSLEEAHARHPFVLRLIGGVDIEEVVSDRLAIERLQWRRDREGAWLRAADVGIMPLPDEDFERGKCAFKIIQYFSAGLPVVCSPIGMNRQVVQHGMNGYLAARPAEWVECLARLLIDAHARSEMAARARQTYLAQFTRERIGERWLEILRSNGAG